MIIVYTFVRRPSHRLFVVGYLKSAWILHLIILFSRTSLTLRLPPIPVSLIIFICPKIEMHIR